MVSRTRLEKLIYPAGSRRRDPGGKRIDYVEVLDTTLRDGAQATGVSFTLQEKLNIARRLDELGVDYIEGGWPYSNPKDGEFFRIVRELGLEHSKIAAFGSTRRKDLPPERDPSLNSLIEAEPSTAVLFGKAWSLHVERVLKCSLELNVELVSSSIEYLKEHGLEVVFDAEHFFDGYKENRDYAIRVLKTAEEAGARVVVLADTNGGALPFEVMESVAEARKALKKSILGIHAHNDSGLAVANTLAAVSAGARHVQGTINGLGERCGNADLVQVLPALIFKMGFDALRSGLPREEKLQGLREVAKYVAELSGVELSPYHPYVGDYAFSHKGGIHIDAVLKDSRAYEHVKPELVGNVRRLAVSEQSGKAALLNEARKMGLSLSKDHEALSKALMEVKRLESEGFQLDNASATVRLILLRALGWRVERFKLHAWRVMVERGARDRIEAEVTLQVNGDVVHGVGEGVGPVHALDLALRDALLRRLPQLEEVRLTNYKVSVVDAASGTGAAVRVFIEFSDGKRDWACTAYSRNIIEASLRALIEGYTYKLVLPELSPDRT